MDTLDNALRPIRHAIQLRKGGVYVLCNCGFCKRRKKQQEKARMAEYKKRHMATCEWCSSVGELTHQPALHDPYYRTSDKGF